MDPITMAVIGSSALSAGAGIAGGLIQANSSKKLMKKQYQLNRKWEIEKAKEGPSWQVEGYEKAGLNPILAVDNIGSNIGNANVSLPDQSGYTSAGQAMVDSVSNIGNYLINKQNADSATKTADTNATVGASTASKNYAEAGKAAEETKYIGGVATSETAKNFAQASELQSKTAVNDSQVDYYDSLTDLHTAQSANEKADWGKHLADSDKAQYEANTKMYESLINATDYQFYQRYGVTKNQAIEILKTGGNIIPKFMNKGANHKNHTPSRWTY